VADAFVTAASKGGLPPLTVEERLAIEELLSVYAISCDVHDIDTTLALFTEDGEFRVFDRVFAGHEKLRKMLTSAAPGLHLAGAAVITPAPEGARVRQQLIFYPADRSEHRLTIYDDVVVRLNGRWLFRSRECRFMNNEACLQSRP
jgi:hypothetical protein